jgi:hypothetical protein
MKKLFILCAICLFASQLFGEIDIDEIRQAIKEKGAKWEAGITSMTILSKEERLMRLGWKKEFDPPPGERGLPPIPVMPDRTYADSLDWRNHNGKNYTTPVQNQGACGSCTCFGTLGSLEGMINVYYDEENWGMNLSEQEFMSCGPGSCSGMSVETAMNWLAFAGMSEEECFPYYANDDIPCSDRCERYIFTKRKINYWGWCYPFVGGVKEHLQNGPIAVAFEVYEDFQAYTGGVYRHTWGAYEGGHCVTMIGWNDADSCWICKNSWGENWGEDGYFRIGWGECMIEDFAAYCTARPAAYPRLHYETYVVDDTVGGDGDGVLNPGETAELVVTISNEVCWSDAQYVDAILRCNDSRVSIVDSTAGYGTILVGESKDNASEPFVVTGVDDGSIDPVEMSLYVTAVGDSGSYWIELEFEIEYGWMQYGWPFVEEQVKTSPAVIDLDNNYSCEVAFGSENGNLFVKKSRGSDYNSFPYHVPNKIWASPAVGDLDNDGVLDIVFAGFNTNIYRLDIYGNEVWSIATGGPITATPALADLDNDNKLEIIVGSFDQKLYVLREDGSSFSANFPMDIPDGSMVAAGCAVGDIDGDYQREIIVASYNGYVYAVDTSGTVITGWPYQTGGNIWDAPSMANLDGTGVKIAIGSTNDTVFVINDDGTLDFKVATSGDVRSSPSFCNVDGDNDLEIFFGSDDGNVYAYHHTGTSVSGWPINLGGTFRNQIVFSDFDNNNVPEIVAVADGGGVYIYEGNGDSFMVYPTATQPKTPAIEDCDNDGDLELFFGTADGVSAIDCKDPRGYGTYWNMFRCNVRRTGNFEDAETGIEETKEITPSVFKIYPNPFKGSVTIAFSCMKNENVDLSIYNVAGQRVKTIRSKGEKTFRVVNWDGTNDASRPVSTGVYFCVARSHRRHEVIKKLIKIE